ncbi:MAG: hypothetical protein JXR77_00340, partial [Lentisphaeria bacterium]|nr:hypothetical protein [Lentisphaeria bacterium]
RTPVFRTAPAARRPENTPPAAPPNPRFPDMASLRLAGKRPSRDGPDPRFPYGFCHGAEGRVLRDSRERTL